MASERTPLISSAPDVVIAPEPEKRSRRWTQLEESRKAHKKLVCAVGFALAFMIVEIIGGFIANSLAIMTDAAHLLSDVAGFLISIVAIWFGTMDATARLSYGFHRAEVIGAIISVMLIWVLTGVLVYEAILRIIDLSSPHSTLRVDGKTMTIVAVCGLAVNLVLMQILGHSHGGHGGGHGHSHGPSRPAPRREANYQSTENSARDEHGDHAHHGGEEDRGHSHEGGAHDGHDHDGEGGHGGHGEGDHGHSHGDGGHGGHGDHDDGGGHGHSEGNINLRAAYVHALGDLIQSGGVCIAGALIWYDSKYQLADPLATILFSFLVMWTTFGVIKSSLRVLMEGTPESCDPEEIEQDLRAIKDVTAVHDLHIWSLTMGKPSLSAHLTVVDHTDSVLHDAQRVLRLKYGIDHVTIQVEKIGTVTCEPCEDPL